jgi:putative membrane protein
MNRFATLLILATLMATPAIAQISNPAGAAPDTKEQAAGVPAPRQANQADRTFAVQISAGGMAEIELARLAEQRSRTDAVKALARRMIQDHSKANEELGSLSSRDHIALEQGLDLEHAEDRDRLASLNGTLFDLEYLRLQQQDHQRAVQLLEYEIGSGQDMDLQHFASRALPVVFAHLQMVTDLMTQMATPETASTKPGPSGMPGPQTPPTPKH